MARLYTEEQLKEMDSAELVQAVLSLQGTLQVMMEQLSDANRHRFGRSSEKFVMDGQISFSETEGFAFFNEAECVHDLPEEENKECSDAGKSHKEKGHREASLKDLPVTVIVHEMSEEELEYVFKGEGYKRLPDEIQKQYSFIPARIGVEEHRIAVYAGKITEKVVKADHPKKLLRNSLVSPSLASGIMTAKYQNAVPLYRLETMLKEEGIDVTRKSMADWMILLSDRYLKKITDRMHSKLLKRDVLQADETPVTVNKDGRPSGSKSYMWVYRTGLYDKDPPVVLYEYQKTRKADHPKEFLKEYKGTCVTDGYQVYHSIDNVRIAGCWAHARRRFDEALNALPPNRKKGSIAGKALSLIRQIYGIEGKLQGLSPVERLNIRQEKLQPLVEAYFSWVKETLPKVMERTKTYEGLQYSVNQEEYLKVFLLDGNVPMDNNAAERTIRPFCVGKKNWLFCDTISGAKSSAIIYSVIETAKANNLKCYEYMTHVLTELSVHQDDVCDDYLEDLMPWSGTLPQSCRQKK